MMTRGQDTQGETDEFLPLNVEFLYLIKRAESPSFSFQLPRNKAREELISRLLLLKTTTCPSCILIDPTCRYYFASVPLITPQNRHFTRWFVWQHHSTWRSNLPRLSSLYSYIDRGLLCRWQSMLQQLPHHDPSLRKTYQQTDENEKWRQSSLVSKRQIWPRPNLRCCLSLSRIIYQPNPKEMGPWKLQ